MKKALLITGMILMTAGLIAQEEKEVVTGAGYANDVYYSLENGTVTTVQRDNWDIGIITQVFSVSILTNGGSGVELYTYTNGDTANWADLDTTGMMWKPLYNSLETWDEGAFSANATGHPDYGWGMYGGMGLITGDSLYVLKTIAGNWKKLAIVEKVSAANQWEFKYANLDGTEEMTVNLNANDYPEPSFVYYSLDSMKLQEREPAIAEWDLLFTKYWDNTIPYSVTGVLANEDHILLQEVRESGMDQSTHNSFEEADFTSEISVIGSDWKAFNMGTFSYDIIDTVVYYVKAYGETDSTYYKMYFTGFSGGMTDGKYTFMQEEIMGVSNRTPDAVQLLEVYPNPASDQLNVVLDHEGEIRISVIDITGRMLQSNSYVSGGFNTQTLNISDLDPGLFFIRLEAGTKSQVVRFIKE
jgi:hypothetical protein